MFIQTDDKDYINLNYVFRLSIEELPSLHIEKTRRYVIVATNNANEYINIKYFKRKEDANVFLEHLFTTVIDKNQQELK